MTEKKGTCITEQGASEKEKPLWHGKMVSMGQKRWQEIGADSKTEAMRIVRHLASKKLTYPNYEVKG